MYYVICMNKVISRHKSFYLAQTAIEKHLKSGKINNNYKIEIRV